MKSIARTVLAHCLMATAVATSYERKSLSDLVAKADYIVVGKVTTVAMFDGAGREIKDPEARTGPGLDHELRSYVRIERGGVLKTLNQKLPRDIVIPSSKMNHARLGDALENNAGNTYIFLLNKEPLREVHPIDAVRWDTERPEIEALIRKQKEKKPNQKTTRGM